MQYVTDYDVKNISGTQQRKNMITLGKVDTSDWMMMIIWAIQISFQPPILWYAWARKMKLRKSHYGQKFGGMVQFTMKRITVWNGHTHLMFAFSDLVQPRVLSFFELVCLVLLIGIFRYFVEWLCPEWYMIVLMILRDLVDDTSQSYCWYVTIGSGNDLVSVGNKSLPEPRLTQIYVAIWHR